MLRDGSTWRSGRGQGGPRDAARELEGKHGACTKEHRFPAVRWKTALQKKGSQQERSCPTGMLTMSGNRHFWLSQLGGAASN